MGTFKPVKEREITNYELILQKRNLFFDTVADCLTQSFCKRIRSKEGIFEIQLRYTPDQESQKALAESRQGEIKKFFAEAWGITESQIEVVIRLKDCCFDKTEKVCLGCHIGAEKERHKISDQSFE